jgi:hypothetical protein
VFGWRREVRADAAADCAAQGIAVAPGFVPIVSAAAPRAPRSRIASVASVIEVELAGAVVRVSNLGDGAELTAVLRAIRASASQG